MVGASRPSRQLNQRAKRQQVLNVFPTGVWAGHSLSLLNNETGLESYIFDEEMAERLDACIISMSNSDFSAFFIRTRYDSK